MKRRLGKFGVIFLALALVLSVTGAAFAMWSDTLTIEGTLNTGEVSVIFDSQYDNDAIAGSLDPCEAGYWNVSGATPVWVGNRTNKDVANTASTYDGDYATITMNTAYPSYWGSVIWDVKNTGTIPVKFWSVNLTELSKGNSTWSVNQSLNISTRYYVDVDTQTVDTTLDAGDDFSFILSCEACCQVDPYVAGTNEDLGYIDVTVHLEQDAEQKTQYDFTIGFVFAQWNEGLNCTAT